MHGPAFFVAHPIQDGFTSRCQMIVRGHLSDTLCVLTVEPPGYANRPVDQTGISQLEQQMKLYWRERKKGFDLCVEEDDGTRFSVGGVRQTKRGIEALAKTMGYDPGRAVKGLPNFEQGRMFVEQFEPWRDFFPGEPLELEREIVPLPEKTE